VKPKTLKDLFLEELKDAYDGEHQILEALPKMAQAASSPDLKTAFEEHRVQTQEHVRRLEQIFQSMGKQPERKTCVGIKGIIAEGDHMIQEVGDRDTLDAGLIAGAQKVEHYEIATYGTMRTWARLMGDMKSCNLLQQTADEEGQTDKRLTMLAERHINQDAETPGQARKAA
jgi:ferritin-like metal-binding protein YciE